MDSIIGLILAVAALLTAVGGLWKILREFTKQTLSIENKVQEVKEIVNGDRNALLNEIAELKQALSASRLLEHKEGK